MRRSTVVRSMMGTLFMFGVLLTFTIAVILVEHWLDNFKAH